MAETEADKWLQYFDDMRGPGEVLGVAGSGATGAMAGNGSTAVTNGTFNDIINSVGGNGSTAVTNSAFEELVDRFISFTGMINTKNEEF
jgi:hypothetical protein